jgi:Ser/Thr protein kinase RdoA (MazF antagonist)
MDPLNADTQRPPFADLTPDHVLDAIETTGVRTDGSLFGLNSYENRVYQVGMEDAAPLIAKFYRPQRWSDEAILEEHAFVAELAAEEIPAVPAQTYGDTTLHHHGGFRFSLFERRGGRAPELDDRATREWIGRLIGRMHAVGATRSFKARPTIELRSMGVASRDYLFDQGFIPDELADAYRAIAALALDGIARGFDAAGDVAQLRLHGDCHPGNILWTDAGPHFVDFDDSRTGPAIQDLWMLLPGDRADASLALGDLIAGYEDFRDFDDRELALIEPLRTLRLIYYAAWLARRWHDPAFPAAFPWFNTQRYWQDRILELREQVAAMEEPPLRPVR